MTGMGWKQTSLRFEPRSAMRDNPDFGLGCINGCFGETDAALPRGFKTFDHTGYEKGSRCDANN